MKLAEQYKDLLTKEEIVSALACCGFKSVVEFVSNHMD